VNIPHKACSNPKPAMLVEENENPFMEEIVEASKENAIIVDLVGSKIELRA